MACWLCGFKTNGKEERTMCKDGPCQICVELEQVNKEVNQTMAILHRLIAKRRDLRSERNRAHDLVNRLPVELKNYIFQLLLPLHEAWGESAQPVIPSYLASVCRAWRDTALLNPFLWPKMSIQLGKSTPNPLNFVHNWVLRSQILPLTFHFEVVDRSEEGLARSRGVLADIMAHYSNRLQSLSLHIPSATLCNFRNDLQWHRLTQLRIMIPSFPRRDQGDQQPLFNTTASPEKIEVHNISFQALHISWNRLSSATLRWIKLEDIALIFQHASQMTHCHIFFLDGHEIFLMHPIIHNRLETLSVHDVQGLNTARTFLGSLTLPRLQQLNTNEMIILTYLPALVHRSSCPLTRLTLFHDFEAQMVDLGLLQAFPGVTDLVVDDSIEEESQAPLIEKLLLEEYFPDLCQLTFRLPSFVLLWDMGVIPVYLERLRSDGPSEGRLHKLLVVDPGRADEFEDMWNSDGEQMRALGIGLREDGFELL